MTGKGKHKVLQLPATITGSTEDNQKIAMFSSKCNSAAPYLHAKTLFFKTNSLLDMLPFSIGAVKRCLISISKIHSGPVEAGPEEGHEDAQRAEATLLWRQAERAGGVQLEEEKGLRRPHCSLPILQGGL